MLKETLLFYGFYCRHMFHVKMHIIQTEITNEVIIIIRCHIRVIKRSIRHGGVHHIFYLESRRKLSPIHPAYRRSAFISTLSFFRLISPHDMGVIYDRAPP